MCSGCISRSVELTRFHEEKLQIRYINSAPSDIGQVVLQLYAASSDSHAAAPLWLNPRSSATILAWGITGLDDGLQQTLRIRVAISGTRHRCDRSISWEAERLLSDWFHLGAPVADLR